MSSVTSGAKKGGEWTYKIYFSPDAHESSAAYEIEDEELISRLENLVDVQESVENIWGYKHALWSWQLTEHLLYHMFILFETKDWWWSIEKNSEGITIQRSKDSNDVKLEYRKKSRPDLTLMAEDTGGKSILDLIHWLYQTNELNKEYNYLSSNCQHFGQAVFNYVAQNKTI